MILPLLLSLTALTANAAEPDTLTYSPKTVHHVGGFALQSPVVLDSVNAKQERFSADNAINTPLSLSATSGRPEQALASLTLEKGTLNLITFDITAQQYLKPTITVTGASKFKAYADGNEMQGNTSSLQPGTHTIAVKFIADSTAIGVSLTNGASLVAATQQGGKRPFTMTENLGTRYVHSTSLSPSGRWAVVTYSWYDAENRYQSQRLLVDTKTRQSSLLERGVTWMPRTDRYYFTQKESGKTLLKTVDPLTGAVSIISSDLPCENFAMSPTEDFLILSNSEEGPKKEDGVYQIVHPDDRQPGWRSRSSLSRYDLATGFVQPLTYTYHPLWLNDISADGKRILFSVSTDSLTQRPTSLQTLYELDLATLQTTTVIDRDGFIAQAMYAGNDIVYKASTEAFGGVGNRVPEGMTPNMYDYHLYLQRYDADGKWGSVQPLTADDATSIEAIDYSPADGNVYYTAQNGDSVSLYRMSMKTLKSVRVRQPLEVLTDLSIAYRSGELAVSGSSPCVPNRAYKIVKNNVTLVCDPNEEFYSNVALGTVHPWRFTCKRGYDVTGFYYLPADFDVQKKYPVIVHYYGGCSPTSRRFGNGSHYPAHYWNALGYIVFIVNPSGASGFGQEWAARHVNTMGEGVAEDVIEATEQFAKDVPQVDADHIGCVSASYGGFMTQCMLTKTDLFACGISHAGISDHTSYWGEGYWGYSYSEVSAANSYPWTRRDLFVDRSPLYNADKIHKPILFTHGTVDTNVPIGESIQMYTAMKLLGIPTALILVEGENHGIMDPTKRTKWINSMTAWFDMYLKGNDSWWKAIYTEKKM